MAQWTYAQIEQLWINNGGPQAMAPIAAAIAMAESGGNDQALNNNPATGDYSVGLWQTNYYGSLMSGRTQEFGSPQQLLNDANAQAHSAVVISSNGTDFRPWTTYTHGTYRSDLQSGVSPSGTGSPAPGSLGGGTSGSAPDVNVGNQAAAPYVSSAIPGVPSQAPPFPDFTSNPTNEAGRVVSWVGEFAGWAFFIAVVFLFGLVLFLIGVLTLVAILAGPAVGPIAAMVGSKSPAGRAALFANQAVTNRRQAADDAQLEAQRAGTTEPRSRHQANREAEEALDSAGVSQRSKADRRTRREMLLIEERTHKGRRVPASASGPAF